MKHVVEIELAGRRLTLETGRIAKQADGAIWATYGDTVVLATAVASQTAKPGVDFLPLTVDYQEKTYAAGKIGSEAFISCYCHLYDLRGWMFRFGNVLGSRVTHGVIFDFIRKLRENPRELMILGDGTQEKNYFLTEECIGGMAWSFLNIPLDQEKPCDVFNLGTTTVTRVTEIARIVIEEMGLRDVNVTIQGARRAWLGDQPKVHFSVDKINRLGWHCRRSSDEAVRTAVRRVLGKEPG